MQTVITINAVIMALIFRMLFLSILLCGVALLKRKKFTLPQ